MKDQKKHHKAGKPSLADYVQGADENNLAEFPLALLSDKAPPGLKTLEFQDTVKDWKTGREVTRRVSITGSDKFGLPTAKDDQVLAALLQLTGIANNFTNPEVVFTKHQVIELLHWDDSGWAYDRVEESLHRWKDVSIHYWSAWRDHEKGVWTDTEAVGVIDYFKITDGRRTQAADRRSERSRFVWNREFFKSFQAGYMKPLDFGFYRSLKRPAAQRAYRFLDKRFFHKPEWELDLQTFACEKLGFSRNYDTGQLKARLHPAMLELEQAGYIKPVTYRKVRPKTWNVLVSRTAEVRKIDDEKSAELTPKVVESLVARGIARATAESLADEFSQEAVQEKIAYIDWLVARKDRRSPDNVAGFLVAAIRNSYPLPKDYLKSLSRRRAVRPTVVTKQAVETAEQSSTQVEEFLATLTPLERATLEERAVEAADPRTADGYRRSKSGGGPAFAGYQRIVLERYVSLLLEDRGAPCPIGVRRERGVA